MKFAVVTFGCRVNQADSLAIEGQLRARGAVASTAEHADVVVVNTCSVTATADQGARQTIRRLVRLNPSARVVVTGCYATREPEALAALPNVIHVIANTEKDALVERLANDGVDIPTAARFGDGDGPCGAVLTPGAAGRTAFTLRVQTGCDERCSYCIIPKTRGAGRSRPVAGVLADIRAAVDAGYKEVIITGVHLGSYGRDLCDGTSLTALVRALDVWPDEVLFRISSLEPMDCTAAIVRFVAGSSRIAPHFHLPMQHGSDEMLRAMRRPYTAREYRRLVESIRGQLPHASIGSDVIAGFPGETERQFTETRSLLEELPLTHVHVFPYSDRPGTDASAILPKVDGLTIRARCAELRSIGEAKARAFRQSQVGSRRRALTVDDGTAAVTDNYLKLRLEARHPRNEWITVTL